MLYAPPRPLLPSAPPAPAAADGGRIVFGPFALDLGAAQLKRDGASVDLPPRPFALLAHLAARAGQLVSKDELLDAVWGHRHLSDSALKVAINALRSALGDDPRAPRYLETVSRRGYRFVARPADGAPAPVDGAAPQPGALQARPAGNLPPAAPGLIGRGSELQVLQALLADMGRPGAARLLTLVGAGGVGKTRLALAAAGHAAPADGVWLLRLDAMTDAAPLVASIARTLSLSAAAGQSASALATALAPLSLRLLLDNAEHLVAEVAALASSLLEGAAGLQLLVTSQQPLRLAGERRQMLEPLAVPAEPAAVAAAAPASTLAPVAPVAQIEQIEQIARVPAAALFVERVRALQPEFDLDAASAPDVAALCRALDGLPLALELAAARVPLLGAAGVRQRLQQRLALPTRGPHEAPARHRTLRAALDWSHGLLPAFEQQVLQRLSVFAGSFGAEAAEAVAGDLPGAVLDALDNLRERSLLQTQAGGDGGAPRLRLFDSVRAYAAERLAEAEAAAGRRGAAVARHRAHLRASFEAADDAYHRTPLLPWLQPLRPEVHNLRAALQSALAQTGAAADEAAVGLLCASMMFWLRAGYRQEAHHWHAAVRPRAGPTLAPLQRARLALAEGQLCVYGQGIAPAQGLQSLQAALPVLLQAGDTRRAYHTLYLEASLWLRVQPDADRSEVLARMRALEGADWAPRERWLGDFVQAFIVRDRGNLVDYHDHCVDLLGRCRALGDLSNGWAAAQMLAQALRGAGRHDAAIELLDHLVAELRAAGLLREQATVADLAACLRLARDASDQTVALAREAAVLLRSDGMLWWMADALAWLPLHQGRWQAAAKLQGWADALARRRGDRRGPVFGALRAAFQARLAAQPDAAALQALVQAGDAVHGDADAIALCFGG